MRGKCVELHKSGNSDTKIATCLKMPLSTIRVILKKLLEVTGTVINLPGRGPMFIFLPRTARRMMKEANNSP